MSELSTWLAEEVERRGWSYRELARRAGISQSLVSRTLSGNTKASADFCIKVAQALGEPPEKLLRLAEILPPLPAASDNPTLREVLEMLPNLSPQQQREALHYIRYLYRTEQEESGDSSVES